MNFHPMANNILRRIIETVYIVGDGVLWAMRDLYHRPKKPSLPSLFSKYVENEPMKVEEDSLIILLG